MSQYANIELGNLMFGNSRGNYAVDREKFQDIFWEFFEKYGIDAYGEPDRDTALVKTAHEDGEKYYSAETDAFWIHPYYWGEDEEAQALPNFFYKPEGIEISWYKYMMRDAYSNVELTEDMVREMLRKCGESIEQLG